MYTVKLYRTGQGESIIEHLEPQSNWRALEGCKRQLSRTDQMMTQVTVKLEVTSEHLTGKLQVNLTP